jgi:phage terminase small subunit
MEKKMTKAKEALQELQQHFESLELTEEELAALAHPEIQLGHRTNLFINYYILNGFNGAAAARKCGYSPKNLNQAAQNILKRPGVREEIERRCAAFAQAKMATREMLTAKIYELIQDLDHNNTSDRNFILKAIDQLAKLQGLYQSENQVNIQTNTDKEITINIVKPNGD